MTDRFQGEAISWEVAGGVIELALHRGPCNEIGSISLKELEQFTESLDDLSRKCHALIIHSAMPSGFCAGADLRELYQRSQEMQKGQAVVGVREFLERIHRALNTIDAAPLTTIAAIHGVTFGGGFELALVCDLIIADKMARFAFPELRLGLIPGFGGIPRLKRDLGNAVVRDLLFTGRSVNAARAQAAGLVAQLTSEGQVLKAARSAAAQITKFDTVAREAAKRFVKPVPVDELRRE